MPETGCLARDKPTHLTEDEKKFLQSFENCSLPEEEWMHRAHLKVAWLYLVHLTSDEALDKIRAGILRYNTVVLDRRIQYHETVTVAFTQIIAERMEPGDTWPAFEKRNADLFERGLKPILCYYSEERLMSEEARTGFVDADIQELPRRGS